MMPGLLRYWSRARGQAVAQNHWAGMRSATMSSIVKFLRMSMQSLVLGLARGSSSSARQAQVQSSRHRFCWAVLFNPSNKSSDNGNHYCRHGRLLRGYGLCSKRILRRR